MKTKEYDAYQGLREFLRSHGDSGEKLCHSVCEMRMPMENAKVRVTKVPSFSGQLSIFELMVTFPAGFFLDTRVLQAFQDLLEIEDLSLGVVPTQEQLFQKEQYRGFERDSERGPYLVVSGFINEKHAAVLLGSQY